MPLFELADDELPRPRPRATTAVGVTSPPPPAPVVAIPYVYLVLPPEGELLTRTAYNASLRTTYFDEEGIARAPH